MNRIRSGRFAGLVMVLAAACIVGLLPSTAQAQPGDSFQQGTFTEVHNDFNSGYSHSYFFGQNAVPTSISSGASFQREEDGEIYIYTHMQVNGVWGNPGSTNPYYDFLEYGIGLNTSVNFQLTDIERIGEYDYFFDDVVNITLAGHAGIFRNDERTYLTGQMWSNENGFGAIPIHSSTSVQIYDGDVPDFVPGWQTYSTTRWLVIVEPTLVPAPGAAALLGLGGLMTIRRRRR
jgi:hypothetical protein